MKKRILFLMSDTGGGHRAAAEAISAALLQRYGEDNLSIELVDVFKSYSPFPLNYMPEFYPWLIKNGKSSWGMGYKLSNSRRSAKVMSRAMYVTAEKQMKRMVHENPADVIVCVHSVLTRPAVDAFMHAADDRPPFLTVVTDLVSTHMFWYDKRVERTLVPTEAAFERGVLAGLKPEHMRVTGLPVHPRFSEIPSQHEARAALGWDPHLPAILMVGGGEGMGPLYKNARALNARKLKCQLVIIAGRNKSLQTRLEESDWNQPTHIYGFMKDMPRLMAASSILVSKAGPATICEACIAGLPMILFDAIPGQETGNVDYVVDNNAGVFAPTPRSVADAAEAWLAEGSAGLRRRSENARRIAHPNAVWDIADEIWQYAHHPRIPTQRSISLIKRISATRLLDFV
ncbi:MAG: glycosyltransferase [Anaerolineae bacterium]|nr:glycosyltransferase [Anaerolineae bacterium]